MFEFIIGGVSVLFFLLICYFIWDGMLIKVRSEIEEAVWNAQRDTNDDNREIRHEIAHLEGKLQGTDERLIQHIEDLAREVHGRVDAIERNS